MAMTDIQRWSLGSQPESSSKGYMSDRHRQIDFVLNIGTETDSYEPHIIFA